MVASFFICDNLGFFLAYVGFLESITIFYSRKKNKRM